MGGIRKTSAKYKNEHEKNNTWEGEAGKAKLS